MAVDRYPHFSKERYFGTDGYHRKIQKLLSLFLAVLENRVRASRGWDLDAKPFTVREKLNLGFTLK
jgi:hypothetical protein